MVILGIIDLSQDSTDLRTKLKSVVIMGGTFNPIHNGHLRTAVEVLDYYQFSELRLVPCFQPVHKECPLVTPNDRLTMVQMASQLDDRLVTDNREISRMNASYTIDTLREIRVEVGNEIALVLLLGMDSFLSLPAWKEWQKITDYAHILVVSRPGWEPNLVGELSEFYKNSRALDGAELQFAAAGKIYMKALTPLSISSTMIRTLCHEKKSIAYLLPDVVQRFIEQHKLYL